MEGDKRFGLIRFAKTLIGWGQKEKGRKPNQPQIVSTLRTFGVPVAEAEKIDSAARSELLNERLGLDKVKIASLEEIKEVEEKYERERKSKLEIAMKELKKNRQDDSVTQSSPMGEIGEVSGRGRKIPAAADGDKKYRQGGSE